MKRLGLALLLALSLTACGSGASSTGDAQNVSIENVGSAGEVVRFTLDAPADCTILGHGIMSFGAGTHTYDVPSGTTLADDPVWCSS